MCLSERAVVHYQLLVCLSRPVQVWSELRNFKKCLIQMFMKQVGLRDHGLAVSFLRPTLHLPGILQNHSAGRPIILRGTA